MVSFIVPLQELFVGDHSGVIYRWNLKNDESEQLIPEPGSAIQSIDIDPQGKFMAVVNSKVMKSPDGVLIGDPAAAVTIGFEGS